MADKDKNTENSIITDVSGVQDIYNKPTKAVPVPPRNIGIDTDNKFFETIIGSIDSSSLNIGEIERFTQVSQSRDSVYTMLDNMGNDSIISAVLETYAEDATEYNEQGKIVWAESSNSDISNYVSYLLESMGIDKQIYKWALSLCKYGDLYIRLYRNSDFEDPIFGNSQYDPDTNDSKKPLNEDVKIIAYSKNDRYAHYVEMVPNPAEMFELVKLGKTQGYIKAPVGYTGKPNQGIDQTVYQYHFNKKDVEVYSATDFVHAALEDSSSRTPEEVEIFLDNNPDSEKSASYKYSVRRGQSILYNAFKVWRELMLLENSVLLNRVTRSSILRIIGVEVGDMPKENVNPHLMGVKNLIEQKTAIKVGDSMNEYTSPGPVENNIYVSTRNGIGNITTQTIGGDVDVKSLADLEYFKDKVFGSLRVPKQFFAATDDSTGFNGGTSLTIISSRYAKAIKRIQKTLTQAITDIINLMLLDKGLNSYVNEFSIHLLPPTTQEEIDRRDSMSNRIGLVNDIMNVLSDVEGAKPRLEIAKALLSNILSDSEVISIITDEIEKLEEDETAENAPSNTGGNASNEEDIGGFGSELDMPSMGPGGDSLGGGTEESPAPEEGEGGGESLPSAEDLGIDMTDNNA